jgi:hypothetical protein
MPTTRQTYDAVLKEFYLPKIREVLNNEVFMLTQMSANSEDVEGRRAVLSVRTGRNSGVGSRLEMDPVFLPTAGQQGYSEERVPLKYHYGRILISGPVMRSTASDRGSFTRALTSETEGVASDLKNDINRQIFGTSDGTITVLTAAASSTTVTVLAPTNPTTMRQLTPGMRVDIGAVGAVSPATRTIQTVNAAAGTFTVDTAVTVAGGDVVSRAGASGTGASQKELTGLRTQINNTGALWNIDPATVGGGWASYVSPQTGTVNEDMFIQAQMEVNLASGEELDLWVTDAAIHRKVAGLLTSLKRFPVPLELKGGWSSIDMSNMNQGNQGANTVGMRYDKDCPAGIAFGITTKRFQWYRMSDWEFMQEDGAVLARIVGSQGQDAYEGTLFCYAEMATDGRNAHARINGLTFT